MQTRFQPAQLLDPDVAASEQILRKCVHCGFCIATCPTYVLLGDELDGPRGRIYLIKDMLESGRPATAAVVPHLDRCLSCLACMTTCPSGVHYQHLIDHARVHVERTYRRPWHERVLRASLISILPYPGRLRFALAAARLARGLARLLPHGVATLATRALPSRLAARLQALVRLSAYRAPRFARDDDACGRSRAAVEPGAAASPGPHGTQRGRVALLAGCAQSVLTPQAQASSVRLLERAGFEVVVIEGCCGALVHHMGKAARNRALAAQLIGRIEAERRRGGLDAVVVTASGCGTHLKDYGYLFRDEASLARAAAATSDSTRDITEWLHECGWSAQEGRPAPDLTVAYHSACSMQHGQRLGRIPQSLLERAGFRVVEIPEGHLCCGSAGTYNILEPEIAAQLRDRKLANIRRTSVRVVATGNVGCCVQLAGAPDLQIVHTAQLLDWAQGGPAPVTVRGRNG
ncbi:MAG: heterodisulfide reductase-related iron-sulfur binding cluster [Steroidobacteraceae bacterium]